MKKPKTTLILTTGYWEVADRAEALGRFAARMGRLALYVPAEAQRAATANAVKDCAVFVAEIRRALKRLEGTEGR